MDGRGVKRLILSQRDLSPLDDENRLALARAKEQKNDPAVKELSI